MGGEAENQTRLGASDGPSFLECDKEEGGGGGRSFGALVRTSET